MSDQSLSSAVHTNRWRIDDPFNAAREAILRGDWATGAAAYAQVYDLGEVPSALDELLAGIAQFHLGKDGDRLAWLTPELIEDADGEAPLRHLLLVPLVRSERFEDACRVLEPLAEVAIDPIGTRRNLASLLARIGREDDAIKYLDESAEILPDELSVQGDRIRFRLMAGYIAEAAAIASEIAPEITESAEEAQLVLQALLRNGDIAQAMALAGKFNPAHFSSPELAASVVYTYLSANLPLEALEAGEAAIAAGADSPALRGHLGEAMLHVGSPKEISETALAHLEAGLKRDGGNKRLNALYGEALLKSNRAEEAVQVLEKASRAEIKSPKTRLLYARALRATGRFDAAADEYVQVLERKQNVWSAHRQAAGALKQAGRIEEANQVFQSMIAKRRSTLAPSFQEALASLDDRIEDTNIPQTRLDWAWSLYAEKETTDRSEWERRAKWGMLADHMIVDWLECCEEQAEEAVGMMGDVTAANEILEPLKSKGGVIATAHVGPLFSGPILLRMCDMPSRWVASTPALGDAHYASSVISTSDQTDSQVVRECLKSLDRGQAVGIAIDGSGRLGSPTTPFQGQDISYSDFAAKAAYRSKLPSVFYAARWEGDRLDYTLAPLPSVELDESLDRFEARWREAYLAYLLDHLTGPPENLRMAGGLWARIRPM